MAERKDEPNRDPEKVADERPGYTPQGRADQDRDAKSGKAGSYTPQGRTDNAEGPKSS